MNIYMCCQYLVRLCPCFESMHRPRPKLHSMLPFVAVQNLDEARHVRALEVLRQVHVHVEVGDRVLFPARPVLDLDRVVDVLDADLVDRDAAGVGQALDVLDRGGGGFFDGNGEAHRNPVFEGDMKVGQWSRKPPSQGV